MKNLFCLLFLASVISVSAQVAITTDGSSPDNSSILDVKSTTQGMLMPRMTLAQRNAITSPARGLTVFQTDNIPGIYFNSGTPVSPIWVMAGSGSFWSLAGNTGTTVGTNFLGTTDGQPLMFKVNNQKSGYIDYDFAKSNTGFGYQTLNSITSGNNNTANGMQALFNNTTGYKNTANGVASLVYNTTGFENTANGYQALYNNGTGAKNTAIGTNALNKNVAGDAGVAIGYNSQYYANNQVTTWDNTNTSIGYQSLRGSETPANNTGTGNTVIGRDALYSNSSGSSNTANGYSALFSNSSGNNNAANGYGALYSNSSGSYNTANGYGALYDNTIGSQNTATGLNALEYNTEGSYNTAYGMQTLSYNNGNFNTAIGNRALSNNIAGTLNIAVGYDSGTGSTSPNASNTIGIGNASWQMWASNFAFFGGTSTVWNGGNVTWSTYSDARVKNNVQEDVKGLDFITRLRPVTYYRSIKAMAEITGNKETGDYPEKYDIEKIKFSGFLAQDVEQAAKESNYDFSGITIPKNSKELYTLSYEQFVVPLVKAVQELNSVNETQKKLNEIQQIKLDEQQQMIEQLLKRIEKLETK